tara:strand:+ start:1029 stop:1205 length:177 start_codon:yes stop_codon:yes gene_type:complete
MAGLISIGVVTSETPGELRFPNDKDADVVVKFHDVSGKTASELTIEHGTESAAKKREN